MSYRIFAINPGSTSTKIALFEDEKKIFSANIDHEASELARFNDISEQFDYRREIIECYVEKAGYSLSNVDAFSGRGGGLVSVEGGTYDVNDILLEHARVGFTIKHPATLGPQLAYYFAKEYGAKAFVVNPPDVDEFNLVSRITGIKDVYRESRVHALNQKEVGIRYADSVGRKYSDLNLIICHIGGGVSVTAHEKGRMIDSNDIANGDGPFAPTRCGSIPVSNIVDICFSSKYTKKEVMDLTRKSGGFVSLLGTSDCRDVAKRMEEGDRKAKLYYDAMIYQIAKYIGAMAVSLKGKVDAIILTGGISKDKYVTDALIEQSGFIAPTVIMGGEFEMEALSSGALRVLRGEESAKVYTGIPVWNGIE